MAGGLLGYAASMGQGINSLADWLEERARFAGGRVKRLATDPVGLLGTMASEAGKSFTDFADAAARGDTQATVEGLLNSGLAGPLTFAGVGAKTADKVALQKAKQMANVGEDPVKIWQTTGWTEQFPDKKWRFEIPDNTATIKGKYPIPDRAPYPDAGQFVEHPQLFNAYPDLATNVKIYPSSKSGEVGSYSAAAPPIRTWEDITIGNDMRLPAAKSVTGHELQHAIQQREGFARGGSPESAGVIVPEMQDMVNSLWKEKIAKGIDPSVAAKEALAEARYATYLRLAGEAEARLTQSRMNLTPAERMQRPPWLEFDVPPEQQIVRGLLGENTGPAMAADPKKYGISHRPMTVEGGAARLHDLTPSFGEDVYGKNAQQYFGGGDQRERAILRKFSELRGKPDAEVTIYRGIPKNAEGKINPGDWVSLDRSVAEQAGEKVVSMKVKAKDITAWADSLLEQGYWPQGGGLLGQQ